MIATMYRDIIDGANELHYVFEHKDGILELNQKPASSCHSNHARDLKEVFIRYFDYFDRMGENDGFANKVVLDWANKLNMSVGELVSAVRRLYTEVEMKYPEKLI